MSSSGVRKAVIPAAGLGTRFLPATKATPKELFPLFDKPAIQFVIEEAVASGVEVVVLIVSDRKKAVLEYFCPDPELEELLLATGKTAEAARLQKLSRLCQIEAVYQDRPAGLGHAIGCARAAVGDEPFLVLLPDVIILSDVPCAKQLIDCYAHNSGCVIATRKVHALDTAKFGILAVEALAPRGTDGRVYRVKDMVEKPDPAAAPSRFGVFGRYLLEPDIFEYIDRQTPDSSNEVQLTPALGRYAAEKAVYGLEFEGDHFDVGDKVGYIEAILDLALRDVDLRLPILQYLESRYPGRAPAASHGHR